VAGAGESGGGGEWRAAGGAASSSEHNKPGVAKASVTANIGVSFDESDVAAAAASFDVDDDADADAAAAAGGTATLKTQTFWQGAMPANDAIDKQILKLFIPALLNFLVIPLVGAVDVFWVVGPGTNRRIAEMPSWSSSSIFFTLLSSDSNASYDVASIIIIVCLAIARQAILHMLNPVPSLKWNHMMREHLLARALSGNT